MVSVDYRKALEGSVTWELYYLALASTSRRWSDLKRNQLVVEEAEMQTFPCA
jgi:hypothetical protein